MLRALKDIKIGMFIAFANLLIQGISFFVHNFIARSLNTENFGYFGILQTDYSVFSAVADFGMSTLILAFFAKRATVGTLFKNVLQVRLLCALATAVLMAAFALSVRNGHPVFWGELILIPGLIFQHSFFDWYFISGQFWKNLLISKILHAISYASVMAIVLFYFKFNSIEAVAAAMVIAALPAFFFGVTKVLHFNILHFTRRTFRFFYLMIKSAIPYAIQSIATFAYLPIGLYAAGHFASANFLGCYFYSHKLVVLASGFMVHFVSSSLISLHQTDSNKIHIRDIAIFTAFIAAVSFPLWLLPEWTLRIAFFAAPWTAPDLELSAFCLRILSATLLFQALRLSLIATMLKEKHTVLYGITISIAGGFNILACILGSIHLAPSYIPLLTLSGDLLLNLILFGYFVRNRRISW